MTKDCFDKPCRIDLMGMATHVSRARLVGGNEDSVDYNKLESTCPNLAASLWQLPAIVGKYSSCCYIICVFFLREAGNPD